MVAGEFPPEEPPDCAWYCGESDGPAAGWDFGSAGWDYNASDWDPPTPTTLPPTHLPPLSSTVTVSEIIETMDSFERRKSRLAWENYIRVNHLHRLTFDAPPELDTRVFDHFANTAAILAAVHHIDKSHSEALLRESIALVHHIPEIGQCLKNGTINQRQFQQLVSATDLSNGWPSAHAIDLHIAHELRQNGPGSSRRLRDMALRIIFEHDPDAIRRKEEAALARRKVTMRPRRHGMAHLGIIASAEDTKLALEAVEALINAALCSKDSRDVNARRSDAAICSIRGIPLVCDCGRDDCPATTASAGLSDQHARIIVHVICQDSTLQNPDDTDGPSDPDGPDGPSGPDDPDRPPRPQPSSPPSRPPRTDRDHPGFLDGYGVISADHVRRLARRPDAVIRPLNPQPGQALPTHQPSDPYRFSAALDTFIRARDGYCVFPGCNLPAWRCDLDHVDEFDHTHPELGGQTCPGNGNAKCRFHHLFKTFSRWIDDQFIDSDGRTCTEFTSPHGITARGRNNESLFPGLRAIRFQKPRKPPDPQEPRPTASGAGPQRSRTRTADKHARRRRERERNRMIREFHDGL